MKRYINNFSTSMVLPKQEGATCGIYALWIVYNYFCTQQSKALQFNPRARYDRNNGLVSLRQLAKSLNYTKIGEIFLFDDMVRLARDKLRLDVSTIDVVGTNVANITAQIIQHIDQNHPILLAYEADDFYNVSTVNTNTTIAHWGVIVGYTSSDKAIMVETGIPHEFKCNIADLQSSMLAHNTWNDQVWGKYQTTYTNTTTGFDESYKNWQENNIAQGYPGYSIKSQKLINRRAIPKTELHNTLKHRMLVIHGLR